ncbi:hypothetical protein GCM10007063_25950 [Lentibacillus kapialis]|uniref:Transposase IS701-like DDE domain-containing protein n=2 Tax=Lentibacillus kapialis TaxID=340214 RepID=A0A917Q000_9BACI|nr:hypothetical protein GCM10007063_25950 [Lentibacillus kapialis]
MTAHLVSEEYSFAWDFRSCFWESYCEEHGLMFKGKNDLAIELIKDYESPTDEQVYVLVDSWYTSRKLIIDACAAKGYHVIGGLRVNRKIYPAGIGIKISKFASDFMRTSDTRSVTARDHTYKLYTYEGKLSDIENAKALLFWEGEFDSSKTPFCILCTDCSLDESYHPELL